MASSRWIYFVKGRVSIALQMVKDEVVVRDAWGVGFTKGVGATTSTTRARATLGGARLGAARANGRRPRSRPRSSACARRSRLRGRGADPRWRPFVSPRAWGGGRARERERAAMARGGGVDDVVRRLCASRGSGGRGANARASSREGRRRGCRGASRGRNDGRRRARA